MVDEATSEDEFFQCHRGGTTTSTGWGMFTDGTKLESEDSSYDSDYENSEPLANNSSSTKERYGKHEEASRTVSDTLGAEFAEYVGSTGPHLVGKQPVDSEISVEDIFSDPEYTSRIEFALKLGYTEKQAQIALQKLGPGPQQNELLAELIKLGACIQQKSESRTTTESSSTSSSSTPSTLSGLRKVENYPSEGYELRSIVIDGSNVAMSHGNKEVFSCRGIKLCVDWFKSRGHRDITVFVPLWRKEASRPDAITKDQEVLWELEKERRLVFTPSRQMGGRRMACHDDRYILKLAVETDGVVVSNDNYRDLINETPEFKKVIEERLLMFSFVNDMFMPPDDPLGRHGPSLDSFLCIQKKSQELLPRACPYGKKCTYGNKCKYYHPERGNQPHKSVSEQLAEQAKINIQEVKARNTKNSDFSTLDGGLRLKGTLSSPFPNTDKPRSKVPLQRTKSLLPQTMDPLQLPSTRVTVTPPSSEIDQGEFRGSPAWPSQFYGEDGAAGGGSHLSVAKRLTDSDNCKNFQGEGTANLHRKLQRQLTLNPVYDQRLVQMRRYIHQQQQQGGEQQMNEASTRQHQPLVRHSSEGAAASGWGTRENVHQSVTRIASAPDSFHRFQPVHSTEVLSPYMWGVMVPHPNGSSLQIPCARMQTPPNVGNQMMNASMSFNDKRNHLYYHLSSIFPKEQVKAAMDAQPDETDPQAICAAILNTFQHQR